MPTPGRAASLAALVFLAACAGFVDARRLPWQPLVDRTLVAEESVVADLQRFALRRYRETRVGMGEVSAVYIVAEGRTIDTRPGPGDLPVITGLVNGQLFYSNFQGEWYCGGSRSACARALQPEFLPRGLFWQLQSD